MEKTDFYQLALKERIREAVIGTAEDSTDCMIELIEVNESGSNFSEDVTDNMNLSGATCSEDLTSENNEWPEKIRLSGLWCIEEKTDEMVSKDEYDSLKIRLEESRECNERLTIERLNLLEAIKNLTLSAKLSSLSEEAKFELAAIPGESSYDIRFITASILILYDRDPVDIKNLTKSGRYAGKSRRKKIDPEKYLQLKNLFSARVRRNEKTPAEGDNRIALFENLLPRAISGAKKKFK